MLNFSLLELNDDVLRHYLFKFKLFIQINNKCIFGVATFTKNEKIILGLTCRRFWPIQKTTIKYLILLAFVNRRVGGGFAKWKQFQLVCTEMLEVFVLADTF